MVLVCNDTKTMHAIGEIINNINSVARRVLLF